MKININDIKFWMDAIRNSEDRDRTLESFWGGQLQSKEMLVKHLEYQCDYRKKYNIVIHGGWNGVLASLLFNSNLEIGSITSVDIDPSVEETAKTINKNQEMQGRFTAKTGDMCTDKYSADIVINTSCEHLDKEKLQQWFNNIPKGTMYVMQSNNYTELEEHVNCVNSADELAESVGTNDYDVAELVLPKYTRYMISGVK
tara:strand:+ start:1762 stop:2361 length:600 start_codon:yes stop_codon:yes gene_type:complete